MPKWIPLHERSRAATMAIIGKCNITLVLTESFISIFVYRVKHWKCCWSVFDWNHKWLPGMGVQLLHKWCCCSGVCNSMLLSCTWHSGRKSKSVQWGAQIHIWKHHSKWRGQCCPKVSSLLVYDQICQSLGFGKVRIVQGRIHSRINITITSFSRLLLSLETSWDTHTSIMDFQCIWTKFMDFQLRQ